MTPSSGDLRENAGNVEVFDGLKWLFVMELGGARFREVAAHLCAPPDATLEEIAGWIERAP